MKCKYLVQNPARHYHFECVATGDPFAEITADRDRWKREALAARPLIDGGLDDYWMNSHISEINNYKKWRRSGYE